MNYEKLTPERFNEKLKANEYKDLTGAKRAIGKASWKESEREAAREKAAKFFGDSGGSKAKPAKKTAAVKTAKAAASKRAPKKTPVVEKETVSREAAHLTDALRNSVRKLTTEDVQKNPFQTMQIAEHGVSSGTNVINTLTQLKVQNPSADITEPLEAAVTMVTSSLDLANRVLKNLAAGISGQPTEKVVTEAPVEKTEVNGVAATDAAEAAVPGTPAYEAPTA